MVRPCGADESGEFDVSHDHLRVRRMQIATEGLYAGAWRHCTAATAVEMVDLVPPCSDEEWVATLHRLDALVDETERRLRGEDTIERMATG